MRRLPLRPEGYRVAFKRHAPPHYFRSLGHVARGGDFYHQSEPVEELRAQAAFLGVHRANEGEPRRVGHSQSFALHGGHPGSRRIEQHVNQVVGQQVHFIDVKHSAVSRGQQARLQPFLAVGQ